MDQKIVKKIWSIINCIETATPYKDYSKITILPDGPNNIKQITLSAGATEFGGNLKKVVQRYIDKKGKFANRFTPYINRIGKMPSLVSDKNFINNLVHASVNDQLMKDAQDEVFDEVYFQPAVRWAANEGIKTPLGILVIFDSFLQSGAIFTFLRNRFSAKTPRNGGTEEQWITQYVNARNSWLSGHSNKPVRNSAYRTRTYQRLIKSGNWDLKGPIRTEHGCNITGTPY